MGYLHDTAMCQYIPPTAFHTVTATAVLSQAAGAVAGTICLARAAADEVSVFNVPIILPSNTVALKGAKLTKVEVDYTNAGAEATSWGFVLNKNTRGANGAAAVKEIIPTTTSIAAADSHAVDEIRQVVTVTTPSWTDDDEYFLLEVIMTAGGAVATTKITAAFAYYTLRL